MFYRDVSGYRRTQKERKWKMQWKLGLIIVWLQRSACGTWCSGFRSCFQARCDSRLLLAADGLVYPEDSIRNASLEYSLHTSRIVLIFLSILSY